MKHPVRRLFPPFLGAVVSAFAQNPATSVSVDANATRHPIDPNICGVHIANAQEVAMLNAPLNRSGGNARTRYNWQLNAHGVGSDWSFETNSDGDAIPSGSADAFVIATHSAANGAEPLMTIPLIDYLANLDPNRGTLAGFSVKKYGAQAKADPWNSDAASCPSMIYSPT